jgi:thioredoxin 1
VRIVTLTKDNFVQTVETSGVLVVDFWAAWCGPCQRFGPVFERAAARFTDVRFGKVNTEEQPELAGAFEITSIPTLMGIRGGEVVYRQSGALADSQLDHVVTMIRGRAYRPAEGSVAPPVLGRGFRG